MVVVAIKKQLPYGGGPSIIRTNHTLLINENIWMVCDNRRTLTTYNIRFQRFDTATFELETLEFEPPRRFNGFITNCISSNECIYVVVSVDCRNVNKRTRLFEFDTVTRELDFIRFIPCAKPSTQCGPIFENLMYMLDTPAEGSMSLLKYDINENQVLDELQIPGEDIFSDITIMENEGRLYLRKHVRESQTLTVSMYNTNQGLQELNTHNYNNIEGVDLRESHFDIKNGIVLEQATNPNEVQQDPKWYLDIFDLTTNTWNKIALGSFMRPSTRRNLDDMQMVLMGNNLFSFCMCVCGSRRIEMWEIFPSLATICMLQLIDEKNDRQEIEPIREMLSIPLRYKLDNMMSWRIPENDEKLRKAQFLAVVEELQKMNEDELIDHIMLRKFQVELDSDFSDQSDSDITDFEEDPHVSADDNEEDINEDDWLFFGVREQIDEREMAFVPSDDEE